MNEETYMDSDWARKWSTGDSLPYSWAPMGGAVLVFDDSRFFPAKDGTWLMVDYMSDSGNWYVTEGV